MLEFIFKKLIELLSTCTIRSFDESLASNSKEHIKFVSLNNRSCQASPGLSSNETIFHPFTVSVNKCGGSSNIIDDPYAREFVPDKVKNMNVKVFNLILGVFETKFLVQLELCECKCGLNKSLCSSKQKWNHYECWCE